MAAFFSSARRIRSRGWRRATSAGQPHTVVQRTSRTSSAEISTGFSRRIVVRFAWLVVSQQERLGLLALLGQALSTSKSSNAILSLALLTAAPATRNGAAQAIW